MWLRLSIEMYQRFKIYILGDDIRKTTVTSDRPPFTRGSLRFTEHEQIYLYEFMIGNEPVTSPPTLCCTKMTPAVAIAIVLTLITASSSPAISESAAGCFESIVSFGDSLADTGNYPLLWEADTPPRYALPPYGRTFFHRPTGRCSDGRLVIDFIGMLDKYICISKSIPKVVEPISTLNCPAQSLGMPLVQPYIAGGDGGRSFSKGVNFAVVGATALDFEFYEKIGFPNVYTNVSLGTQLDWFKQFLASIPG